MSMRRGGGIGFTMVAGAIVAVIGAVLSFTVTLAGGVQTVANRDPISGAMRSRGDLNLLPLTFTIFMLGVFIFAGGLFYGLYHAKGTTRGARKVLPNMFVVGRICVGPDHVLLHDEWSQMNTEKARFYLHLRDEQGVVEEYECLPAVFFASGEGMYGEAELQGRWVGRFTAYIGYEPPDAAGVFRRE